HLGRREADARVGGEQLLGQAGRHVVGVSEYLRGTGEGAKARHLPAIFGVVQGVAAGTLDAAVSWIRHDCALRQGAEVAVVSDEIRELGIAARGQRGSCGRWWGAWRCGKEMEA